MPKLSRRDFIKISAVGLGSLTVGQFLAACGLQPTPVIPPTTVPTSPVPSTPTTAAPAVTIPGATAVPPTNTAAPASYPDLVVAQGGQPEALVRAALAALGGLGRFVPKGADVILKPNICVAHPYQYAATTNPWVVGALVKLAFETGAARVRVMDYPYGCSAEQGYTISGIKAQVEAQGGEMAYMTPLFKYVKTPIPAGIDLKEIEVFEDILKADVLINVPIAKNHADTRLTLGMKNLMGVILNRNTMHVNLGQRIADLTSLIKPKLTVMDAVRILVADGPSGGGNLNNVRQMDTVIAGPDIVAVDSYATGLFGLKPSDIAYIAAGAAMRLGRMDLQNLAIQKVSVAG
ncbi:MAG: DUF362 domain-containing protein [Anaerolineales bacterium]